MHLNQICLGEELNLPIPYAYAGTAIDWHVVN